MKEIIISIVAIAAWEGGKYISWYLGLRDKWPWP